MMQIRLSDVNRITAYFSTRKSRETNILSTGYHYVETMLLHRLQCTITITTVVNFNVFAIADNQANKRPLQIRFAFGGTRSQQHFATANNFSAVISGTIKLHTSMQIAAFGNQNGTAFVLIQSFLDGGGIIVFAIAYRAVFQYRHAFSACRSCLYPLRCQFPAHAVFRHNNGTAIIGTGFVVDILPINASVIVAYLLAAEYHGIEAAFCRQLSKRGNIGHHPPAGAAFLHHFQGLQQHGVCCLSHSFSCFQS